MASEGPSRSRSSAPRLTSWRNRVTQPLPAQSRSAAISCAAASTSRWTTSLSTAGGPAAVSASATNASVASPYARPTRIAQSHSSRAISSGSRSSHPPAPASSALVADDSRDLGHRLILPGTVARLLPGTVARQRSTPAPAPPHSSRRSGTQWASPATSRPTILPASSARRSATRRPPRAAPGRRPPRPRSARRPAGASETTLSALSTPRRSPPRSPRDTASPPHAAPPIPATRSPSAARTARAAAVGMGLVAAAGQQVADVVHQPRHRQLVVPGMPTRQQRRRLQGVVELRDRRRRERAAARPRRPARRRSPRRSGSGAAAHATIVPLSSPASVRVR